MYINLQSITCNYATRQKTYNANVIFVEDQTKLRMRFQILNWKLMALTLNS